MISPVIIRLLLPLIVGIILHFYTEFSLDITLILLVLAMGPLLIIPIVARGKGASVCFSGLVAFLFFSLGGFLADFNKGALYEDYFIKFEGTGKVYTVEVIEPPEEKENSVKCVVRVRQVDDKRVSGKSLIYFQKNFSALAIVYGDLIQVKATFNPIRSNRNPHEFDYSRYLKIHDIQEQAYVKIADWEKIGNSGNSLKSKIFNLRDFFSALFQNSGLSRKNATVANALILGQKEYLDKDVLKSYSSAGAMHVLAVSGLHVGIVMLILMSVLRPIKKFRYGRKLFLIFVLGGIWLYALVTGMSASVMRASIMFTFVVIGKELQRDTSIYQNILVSAFLLILIEPYIIFQVGFQLSYLAVVGIIYLQPKIENIVYIKNGLLFKVWQISAVSMAAQISTFPLGLYYFHQFPNFFLLSNLIVIPLAFLILILGISYLFFHDIPAISDLIFLMLDHSITALNAGVEWVEKLPYSTMRGISIEWYEVPFIYLILFLGTISFVRRKSGVFFATMGCCLLLLSYNCVKKYKLETENVFFVYNIDKELAIDIFYGSENTFFSSESLIKDDEKLLFHVKHNWSYRSGRERPTMWKNIDEAEIISFGKYKIWIADDKNLKRGIVPDVDCVLIHETTFIDQSVIELIGDLHPMIIFADNVGYKLKKFIDSETSNLKITDLSKNGAFSFYF